MKYRSLTHRYFMRSIFVSYWSIIRKYDLHPSNSFQDIRQNQCTLRYSSLTYIYIMCSIFVLHWFIRSSVTFIHQIVFKRIGKITGPWNIGQWPIYIFFVSHWPIIPSMTFIHQVVFKILSKIIQPWNKGHSDFHLMTWKAGSYGWMMSDLVS